MGTALYFDMLSGISGDMCAGAFLDLGLDPKELEKTLSCLSLDDEFSLSIDKKEDKGLQGTTFKVMLTGQSHHQRTMKDIQKLLKDSSLPPKTRDLAVDIFTNLAKAEAVIHNQEWTDVHFHEVGAVDSIIDIVTAAFAVEYFNADICCSSPFRLGTGHTESQHGRLPVPVPAVLQLTQGLPVIFTGIPMELTTPTGAAIIKTLVQDPGAVPPELQITGTGHGWGSRSMDSMPNMLRIMMGTESGQESALIELKTDIDDSTPETIGYLFERLLEAGALDAAATSVIMKKGRPGNRISVITDTAHADDLKRILFKETTTLGVREVPITRTILEREKITVTLKEGDISCKVGYLDRERVTVAPEYEDCRRAAQDSGSPLKEIYSKALRKAEAVLDERNKQ
jgi:uncharacterized protein (TIGR00299 family) protein